ncbi:MAG: SIS domain-containing protein [Saprospiraceae bacterium]|nr:SIS domain-containing protein [Saprospiraceae bacterium]
MSYTKQYLERAKYITSIIAHQEPTICEVAELFAQSILKGRMVHLFGSGHSRIMVEEMWPRYGSFPGFNPIVELSLTFHNQVVGANGQRQAMFLENVSGLAARILRNFDTSKEDSALIISSSGCNVVPIEMAEQFKLRKIPVVALVSSLHLEGSNSKRTDGKKLVDFADYVLDTGAPLGDAMIKLEGLDTPVSPGSTLGGVLLINCLKAEIANILVRNGKPPKVLSSGKIVGEQRANDLFESAYDEHAHLIAKLYQNVGNPGLS